MRNNFSACVEHWKKTSSRQKDFEKYKTRAMFLSVNVNEKDTKKRFLNGLRSNVFFVNWRLS
jgi:hypothetical protein